MLVNARSSRHSAGMKNASGFTLLELLVVMVIASVLGFGAVSGWHRWQQHRHLNDTAAQIQHFLLRLRSEANWHNDTRLLWHLPGQKWCLGSAAVQLRCNGRSRHTLLAPWQEVRLLSLTEGVGFYGRRSMAKPGRIVISCDAGERHIIVSSRGRIRICQPAEGLCG